MQDADTGLDPGHLCPTGTRPATERLLFATVVAFYAVDSCGGVGHVEQLKQQFQTGQIAACMIVTLSRNCHRPERKIRRFISRG